MIKDCSIDLSGPGKARFLIYVEGQTNVTYPRSRDAADYDEE